MQAPSQRTDPFSGEPESLALADSGDPPGLAVMSDPSDAPDSLHPSGASLRVRVGVGAAIVLVVAALVCSVLVTALSPVGATTVLGPAVSAAGVTSTLSSGSPTDAAAAPSGSPSGSPSHGGSNGSGGGTGASGGGTAAGGATAGDGSGDPGAADGVASDPSGPAILVHVLGAVAVPGVYELSEGARVFDAVGLAGGLTEAADPGSVNLARPLVDGEQLRVLAVGEAPVAPPAGSGGAGAGSGGGGQAGPAPGQPGGPALNLNVATALDLDGLPRIGPAMAARIVAWRDENGPFTSVDDLLQVTGIGDKTLDGLRDLVTV
ncbi:ComEA family DNA-binding protein [Herbiconiux daphne]|uniref:ComEA family DNA-binding protein n=1 Tax=Herbiconiux daphne TaxID=2970914 RepID=A0ABT2GYU4_9MICO|nr:ComEA family DNA-binding protein [Herbiconiux daphne]MCS5733129.1 ComEA family DNA-binding protein [Herbiconiux daphne]